MEARIDRFGRVVIPKMVRDHLGLREGSILYIEESNHNIILKIIDNTPQIKIEDGIAVFTGKAISDIEYAIKSEREQRLKDLGNY
jgi:AbrB family looped-hinge helix DNA binding protein